MKRFACIFTVYAALFFCANSFASVSIGADESKIAVEVYVSSSAGDDSNDGSKSKPFKTFSKIPRKNARIFLKRGDVFYEPLSGLENCVVDSYPNNGKRLPVICGLRFIKNPSAWENMGGGIWRLDMNADANFSGRNPPAATRGNLFNNIGGIYDASSDTLHGRVLKKHSDLKDNWDMISSPEFRSNKVTDQTFRYLYLKLDENPAKYGDSLALMTYGNGVSNIRNCTVRNIAIKGFGRHGLTGCSGGKIENLEIDLIGGSVLVGFPNWVRLGNGIEFWISGGPNSNIHNRVSNCTISRTFDCGSTIQGRTDNGNALALDIVFTGNKYYRCRQAFEHWLASSGNGPIEYRDCKFVRNFAWEMGENEFDSPYLQDLNFLTYDRGVAAMTIRENVCYGAGAYTGVPNWSTDFGDNTFYVLRGKPLVAVLRGSGNIVVNAESDADIEKYRQITGDKTSKIFIVEKDDSALRDKLLKGDFKYVRKFLNKKTTIKGRVNELN